MMNLQRVIRYQCEKSFSNVIGPLGVTFGPCSKVQSVILNGGVRPMYKGIRAGEWESGEKMMDG